jgi:RimJ/RimL family protein N-acetyltransferase
VPARVLWDSCGCVDSREMKLPLELPALRVGPFWVSAWHVKDLALVREASSDSHIPKITTVPPNYTDEEGRLFLQRQWDRAATGAGYSFVIAEAVADRGVGAIGLWLRNIDLGRASIGYWVAPSAQGRHAAWHALCAVRDWAFTTHHIPRLELYVEPWNTPSIRTAERAGFRREGLLRSWETVGGERRDMLMFSLLESDSLPERA